MLDVSFFFATMRRAVVVLTIACGSWPLYAAAPMQKTSAPGFYRTMLGDFEITALLDSSSPWPTAIKDLGWSLSDEQIAVVAAKTKLQLPVQFSTNAFLINTGKKLILIDAGGGKDSDPSLDGKLVRNLVLSGYRPEQIDEIYLTHMHMDHVGGLSDGPTRLFPNAIIRADQRELNSWQTQAAKGSVSAKNTITKLTPYIASKQLRLFTGETELLPGIHSVPAYGHTDGHSFYRFESQGKQLLLIGDFILVDKLQLNDPDLAPPGELDTTAGIVLHKKVYADAAEKGYLIGGAHIAFPGLGRVRTDANTYSWVAEEYVLLP